VPAKRRRDFRAWLVIIVSAFVVILININEESTMSESDRYMKSNILYRVALKTAGFIVCIL